MNYNISETLKRLRSNSSLSVSDVVKKLSLYGIDIKEKTLYGYESGKSMPNADIFMALCSIYGLKSLDIFTKQNLNTPYLYKYNSLNKNGQKKVNDYIDDLIINPKYIKHNMNKEKDNTEGLKISVAARNGKSDVVELTPEEVEIAKQKFPQYFE